jgi:hypothetical protein
LVRQKHESNSEKAKGLGVLLKWYRAYIANTKLSSIPCTIKKKKKTAAATAWPKGSCLIHLEAAF